jgi:uncharacterized protein YjiS (DUF1127 family)
MEMTMSMMTIGKRENASGGTTIRFAAAIQRLWVAYVTWRIEQAAIVVLQAMSDRELNDIGLPRSEIAGAVKASIYVAK